MFQAAEADLKNALDAVPDGNEKSPKGDRAKAQPSSATKPIERAKSSRLPESEHSADSEDEPADSSDEDKDLFADRFARNQKKDLKKDLPGPQRESEAKNKLSSTLVEAIPKKLLAFLS